MVKPGTQINATMRKQGYHYTKSVLTPEERRRKEENRKREQNRKRAKMWIDHNREIVADNIMFARMHPGDFSKAEIDEYSKEAKKEAHVFLQYVLDGGQPVFNKNTQLWTIPDTKASR